MGGCESGGSWACLHWKLLSLNFGERLVSSAVGEHTFQVQTVLE